MSKRAFIARYQLILKKLEAKPYSTLEEIQTYVEKHFKYLKEQDEDLIIGFSNRTFQRDIKEISQNFGIDIEYSRKQRGYFISSKDLDTTNFERRMEAFDLFNALNLTKEVSAYIHLEKRRPKGTENIYGLLHGIKNRFQIQFSYHRFWDEEARIKTAFPYALKEFKNRWYLLAKDNYDAKIKTFALDRLSELEITNQKFEYPPNFNVEEDYRNCFGIIRPNEGEVQDIILSFTPHQGKYIKTLPLHETQQVILDNDTELKIQLRLFITYDLIVELLSHGDSIKVIEPKSLVDEIRSLHERALRHYE